MALEASEPRVRLPQYSMWSLSIVMAVGAIDFADRAQRDALDQVVPAPSSLSHGGAMVGNIRSESSGGRLRRVFSSNSPHFSLA